MRRKISMLLFILLLLLGTDVRASTDETTRSKARIIAAQSVQNGEGEIYRFTARVLDGPYLDNEVRGEFAPYANSQYDFRLRKGMIVHIQLYMHDSELHGDIVGVHRLDHLKWLAVICVLAILLFGKLKGLTALISLVMTGLCILFIYIPMVLGGYEIVFVTILCAVIIIVTGFLLIAGWTPKSRASMTGTLGGVIVAALLASYFCRLVSITGAAGEEVYRLVHESGISLDFSSLFISGVIIGTIGVMMDVSMSVASFIFELKNQSPSMRFTSLVASGLKVGKDIMATMVNTLILAYVGTSMPLLFLFVSASITAPVALNAEVVAGEIIRSLSGTIGLVLTIPLTALIAAYIAQSSAGSFRSGRSYQRPKDIKKQGRMRRPVP